MSERRFTDKPNLLPSEVRGLPSDHPAMLENRTLFPSTVITVTDDEPARLLVSGHNNRKIGSQVEKGPLKGAGIYMLSLEERSTCPLTCDARSFCYGNGMQMARRHRIGEPEIFYDRLESEIQTLLTKQARILVRLHVLGDFPTAEYVGFWRDMLDENDGLNVYGYTHRLPVARGGDEIGDCIEALKASHPDRFRIRWSTQEAIDDGAAIDDGDGRVQGIPCPVQSDATACCATCGLCWDTTLKSRTIVFTKHGPRSTENTISTVNSSHALSDDDIAELHAQVRKSDEAADDIGWIPAEWSLTKTEKLFLNALSERRLLSKNSAYLLLYGDRADDPPSEKILDVYVHKIRAKLVPAGVSIITEHGTGWRLAPDAVHLLDCLKLGVPVQTFDGMQSALHSDGAQRKLRPIVPISLPSKLKPKPLTLDRPMVKMVRPVDMRVEASYQRDMTTKSITLIRRIVANWDWAKFKPPICVENDGVFLVVDGQHTAIAAASHPGLVAIPCFIVEAHTVEQRADSFIAHNSERIVMSPLQLFHARVAKNDPTALAILRIIIEQGGCVPRSPPNKDKDATAGQLVAVSAAERAYAALGDVLFGRLVRIAVGSELAPMAATIIRTLQLILKEPFFASAANAHDADIIRAIKDIPDFESASQLRASQDGVNRYRAAASLIAERVQRIERTTLDGAA